MILARASSPCPPTSAVKPAGRDSDDLLIDTYKAYGAMVFARCRQVLGDADAAADAMQETFLRARRSFGMVRDPGQTAAWLYSIATNLCLNELRDNRRRLDLLREMTPASAASTQDTVASHNLVLCLLNALKPKVRLVAWLCHVDGMTQDEVALLLKISRRAVAKRLNSFNVAGKKFLQKSAR